MKYHKKHIALSDAELRKIITLKYIEKFSLYKNIYQYYWSLICNKKVVYPLSDFISMAMANAIKVNFQEKSVKFDKLMNKNKNEIYCNQVNNINIYELASS
jgi:hypothetical protein